MKSYPFGRGQRWTPTRTAIGCVRRAADAVDYDGDGHPVGESAEEPYRWAGDDGEPAGSTYQMAARYYDPEPGRWISYDPLGYLAGDDHLYSYAPPGSNPSASPGVP